jgi:hypothetical protein
MYRSSLPIGVVIGPHLHILLEARFCLSVLPHVRQCYSILEHHVREIHIISERVATLLMRTAEVFIFLSLEALRH